MFGQFFAALLEFFAPVGKLLSGQGVFIQQRFRGRIRVSDVRAAQSGRRQQPKGQRRHNRHRRRPPVVQQAQMAQQAVEK